jgi:hypothetical protein
MWIDNDSDGTIDEQQFADDFSSNEVTLTYDDNGNLTYDGVFTYVYDGWNRLRKVQRVAAGPTTTDVALYEYFADNRRSEKIVQHSGAEVVENDGGNTTVRFYYGGGVARPPSAGLGGAGFQPAGSRWNILETRNGSDQATFQYVWGTQYVDELVLIDKNLEVTVDSDVDPDVTSAAETTDGDSPDSRFLVHQDRNWNVVALTDYDPDSSTEGAVVERYSYTPYGEVTVLNGVGSGSSEFGNVLLVSMAGHVELMHKAASGGDPDTIFIIPRRYIINTGVECCRGIGPPPRLFPRDPNPEPRTPTDPSTPRGPLDPLRRDPRLISCHVRCTWEPFGENPDSRCCGYHIYAATGTSEDDCRRNGAAACNAELSSKGIQGCRCKHCGLVR